MKRLLIPAGLILAAALAWGVGHWCIMRCVPETSAPAADTLAWMQREFRLDDATFAKVKAAHEAYQPQCGELCLAIAKANVRLRTLLEQSRRMTPELESAIREAQLRHADCHTAMLRHIYETAALLPADAAPQYLQAVTGQLLADSLCIDDVMQNKP